MAVNIRLSYQKITIKVIIVYILISFWTVSSASAESFFAMLLECIEDPCNCGSDDDVEETWNNTIYDRGKKNALCPPYGKDNGRADNTCIVRDIDKYNILPDPPGYPGAFTFYYSNLCGEETPESTYLDPKIRVRGQQCNIEACWGTDDTLEWNGQCVTLLGAYLLPLNRMCARVANYEGVVNSQTPTNFNPNENPVIVDSSSPPPSAPPDPGYTTGYHLNEEGVVVQDDQIYDYQGNLISYYPPKLCLYRDPAFLSITEGFDLFDLNPNKQPLQKTHQLNPIVQAIIFLLQNAGSMISNLGELVSAIGNMFSGSSGGQNTSSSIISDIFNFVGDILEIAASFFVLVFDMIIDILQAIGGMNEVVDSTIYGCVNIPLGPFPPPYCPDKLALPQSVSVQAICSINPPPATGPGVYTPPPQCLNSSTVVNNSINNSVRISYDNYVPLCGNNSTEDSTATDMCVNINGIGTLQSAAALHASTAANPDILKNCTFGDSPCVSTIIPDLGPGYRVIYATQIGGILTPSPYYQQVVTQQGTLQGMEDCTSSQDSMCQVIWGVNTGDFVDVSISYPTLQAQDSSDLTLIKKDFPLTDRNNNLTNFTVSLVYSSTTPFTTALPNFTQGPTQICVSNLVGLQLVGCVERVPVPTPQVLTCESHGASAAGIDCSSDYFAPVFVLQLQDGSNTTSAKITALTASDVFSSAGSGTDPSSLDSQNTVNLAGYQFQAFVTDGTYVSAPFSGINSPNPSTIFGTYRDNISPLDSDGNENPQALYLHGLEYINNGYHVGGQFACLQNPDIDAGCPNDTTMCVLTNLLNPDIIDCKKFSNLKQEYNGLTFCPVNDFSLTEGCSEFPGISTSSSTTCTLQEQDGNTPGDIKIYQCINSNNNINYYYTNTNATTPDVAVCQVSTNPLDRITPDPPYCPISPGASAPDPVCLNAALLDTAYFAYGVNYTSPASGSTVTAASLQSSNNPEYNYNVFTQGVRNKTLSELGLCVDLPQPTCSATDGDDSNASWVEAAVGTQAVGTCDSGYVNNNPQSLLRYCIPDADNQTVGLEPIYNLDTNGNQTTKRPGTYCDPISPPPSQSGTAQ